MNSDRVSHQLRSQLIDIHDAVRDITENALWYRLMVIDNDQSVIRTVLLHMKHKIIDGVGDTLE